MTTIELLALIDATLDEVAPHDFLTCECLACFSVGYENHQIYEFEVPAHEREQRTFEAWVAEWRAA
jgi:hypothetical protein